jgi:hypothetical protein
MLIQGLPSADCIALVPVLVNPRRSLPVKLLQQNRADIWGLAESSCKVTLSS